MSEIVPLEYVKGTLKLKKDIEGALIELGERLYNIKKDEMWQGAYNNFSEFLIEMEMSDAQASKLIKIYTVYVLNYGVDVLKLAQVGQRKLYEVIPLIKEEDTPEVIFERIEGLSSDDVRRMSKAEQAGPHVHEWEKYKRCSICGEAHMIYEDDTE